MKFFVVVDATGHPAVMGEAKLHDHPDHTLDVVGAYGDYDAAMTAAEDLRTARRANLQAA